MAENENDLSNEHQSDTDDFWLELSDLKRSIRDLEFAKQKETWRFNLKYRVWQIRENRFELACNHAKVFGARKRLPPPIFKIYVEFCLLLKRKGVVEELAELDRLNAKALRSEKRYRGYASRNTMDLWGRIYKSKLLIDELEARVMQKQYAANDKMFGEFATEPTREAKDPDANYDDALDSKRRSEGKLQFRQIMVLLSELIPSFANADNTKKGRFIAAITPYEAAKRIGDEFSYINNFAKEHANIVKYWERELKSTKRGRPSVNKYKNLGNSK